MIVVALFPWVPSVVPSSTPSKATEMHPVSVCFVVVFIIYSIIVCVCLSLCVSGLCAFMLYVLNLDNICKEHVRHLRPGWVRCSRVWVFVITIILILSFIFSLGFFFTGKSGPWLMISFCLVWSVHKLSVFMVWSVHKLSVFMVWSVHKLSVFMVWSVHKLSVFKATGKSEVW